jgi:hypothetical protein
MALNAYSAGPHNDEDELVDGEWDEGVGGVFVDDLKGGELDTKAVIAARAE